MPAELTIDPKPLFDLSPYLYMQFMEPLGDANGTLDIGWDYDRDAWREDFVGVTRGIAPPLIRWPGGCLTSYYRWREGAGPRRRPMRNILWGGMDSNRIGTHEFMDLCRLVGADPLMVVNFESDGRKQWARPASGGVRSAGPAEAAAWVRYCNDPDDATRKRNGAEQPFGARQDGVRLWQIGNETSYDPNGFDCETAARRTVAFARAMRKADRDLRLIGWGDSGWAPRMLEIAGEHLQFIAYHQGLRSALPDCPIRDNDYRRDPAATWEHLMSAAGPVDARLRVMREQIAGHDVALALTECHFSFPGRNRCEVLSSWAAGVANARVLNVHARHGDVLKIATVADYCGTKWMNNAVMVPGPRGVYMMPVARVMALFRAHTGRKAVAVGRAPASLDVTASRTGRRVYLHVVNTSRTRSRAVRLSVDGMKVESGKVWEIAADPELEVMETHPDYFAPVQKPLPADGEWRFPAASVTALELRMASG